MEEGVVGLGGCGGAGVARGRRGHGAREGDGAARRAQLDWACGSRTSGKPAAWREAVLTGRSFQCARRCRVIGCVI